MRSQSEALAAYEKRMGRYIVADMAASAAPPDMHETKVFMPAVIEAAQAHGWLVYHTYDSRKSVSGFPDLCMARAGTLMFVELKSARGVMTPEQQRWHYELREVARATHVATHVWRPEHWHDGTIEGVLR